MPNNAASMERVAGILATARRPISQAAAIFHAQSQGMNQSSEPKCSPPFLPNLLTPNGTGRSKSVKPHELFRLHRCDAPKTYYCAPATASAVPWKTSPPAVVSIPPFHGERCSMRQTSFWGHRIPSHEVAKWRGFGCNGV